MITNLVHEAVGKIDEYTTPLEIIQGPYKMIHYQVTRHINDWIQLPGVIKRLALSLECAGPHFNAPAFLTCIRGKFPIPNLQQSMEQSRWTSVGAHQIDKLANDFLTESKTQIMARATRMTTTLVNQGSPSADLYQSLVTDILYVVERLITDKARLFTAFLTNVLNNPPTLKQSLFSAVTASARMVTTAKSSSQDEEKVKTIMAEVENGCKEMHTYIMQLTDATNVIMDVKVSILPCSASKETQTEPLVEATQVDSPPAPPTDAAMSTATATDKAVNDADATEDEDTSTTGQSALAEDMPTAMVVEVVDNGSADAMSVDVTSSASKRTTTDSGKGRASKKAKTDSSEPVKATTMSVVSAEATTTPVAPAKATAVTTPVASAKATAMTTPVEPAKASAAVTAEEKEKEKHRCEMQTLCEDMDETFRHDQEKAFLVCEGLCKHLPNIEGMEPWSALLMLRIIFKHFPKTIYSLKNRQKALLQFARNVFSPTYDESKVRTVLISSNKNKRTFATYRDYEDLFASVYGNPSPLAPYYMQEDALAEDAKAAREEAQNAEDTKAGAGQ